MSKLSKQQRREAFKKAAAQMGVTPEKSLVVSNSYASSPKLPAPWLKSSESHAKTTPLFPSRVPLAPMVWYTPLAWSKIHAVVQHCTTEVGWLGLVEKLDDGDFLITDIFVLPQNVTGATTEFSAEAEEQLKFRLIQEDRLNQTSKLRYWGHSHVRMAVSPSMVDERQFQGYVDDLGESGYYIRGIYNKLGDSKVDVAVKESAEEGWIFQCVRDVIRPQELGELDEYLAEVKVNVKVLPPPKVHRKSKGHYSEGSSSIRPGANGGYIYMDKWFPTYFEAQDYRDIFEDPFGLDAGY